VKEEQHHEKSKQEGKRFSVQTSETDKGSGSEEKRKRWFELHPQSWRHIARFPLICMCRRSGCALPASFLTTESNEHAKWSESQPAVLQPLQGMIQILFKVLQYSNEFNYEIVTQPPGRIDTPGAGDKTHTGEPPKRLNSENLDKQKGQPKLPRK
jgi:hypothetical protein